MEIRGVVVDLDGTVYLGEEPIPGSARAIDRLRERGLDLLFVTNNPTRTREAYVERLAGMGVEATPAEVLSAGTVTSRYVARHHPDAQTLLIGSDGLQEQLRDAGVRLTGDPDAAEVVVTSHDHEFDYDDLTRALWALEGATAFYGSDPDLVYPGRDGRPYPGSGAITGAVANVARREPDLVFGKPSEPAVRTIERALDHPPERLLVVGDGLDTDVALGEAAGFHTAFVLSGRGSRAELAASDATPDHVLDRLADLPALLDEAGAFGAERRPDGHRPNGDEPDGRAGG